jgi:hypothetical protein
MSLELALKPIVQELDALEKRFTEFCLKSESLLKSEYMYFPSSFREIKSHIYDIHGKFIFGKDGWFFFRKDLEEKEALEILIKVVERLKKMEEEGAWDCLAKEKVLYSTIDEYIRDNPRQWQFDTLETVKKMSNYELLDELLSTYRNYACSEYCFSDQQQMCEGDFMEKCVKEELSKRLNNIGFFCGETIE